MTLKTGLIISHHPSSTHKRTFISVADRKKEWLRCFFPNKHIHPSVKRLSFDWPLTTDRAYVIEGKDPRDQLFFTTPQFASRTGLTSFQEPHYARIIYVVPKALQFPSLDDILLAIDSQSQEEFAPFSADHLIAAMHYAIATKVNPIIQLIARVIYSSPEKFSLYQVRDELIPLASQAFDKGLLQNFICNPHFTKTDPAGQARLLVELMTSSETNLERYTSLIFSITNPSAEKRQIKLLDESKTAHSIVLALIPHLLNVPFSLDYLRKLYRPAEKASNDVTRRLSQLEGEMIKAWITAEIWNPHRETAWSFILPYLQDFSSDEVKKTLSQLMQIAFHSTSRDEILEEIRKVCMRDSALEVLPEDAKILLQQLEATYQQLGLTEKAAEISSFLRPLLIDPSLQAFLNPSSKKQELSILKEEEAENKLTKSN